MFILIIVIILFQVKTILPQVYQYLNNPGGRVTALAVANDGTIISGTYNGQFLVSEDGLSITNYLTVPQESQVGQIIINPNNKNYIYIHSFLYKYRTTDFGTNWELIDYSGSTLGISFIINKSNPACLYMVRSLKEIWKSYDKGENWFKLKEFTDNLYSIAISESDTSVLYASAEGKIYKSTNSGIDWLITNNSALALQIEVNKYNPATIYYRDRNGRVFKSRESGANPLMIKNYASKIIMHPTDTLTIYCHYTALVGPGAIEKTTDEGLTWTVIFNQWLGEPTAIYSLALDPNNPEILYAGIGDLGIFKSTNGGNDWEPTRLSNSYMPYYFELDKNNPEKITVGQYGWGIIKTTDGGINWHQAQFYPSNQYQLLKCADIVYNPQDSNEGYLAAKYTLHKTTDGGESWVYQNKLFGVNAIAYHPANPNILVAGLSDISLSGASYIYRSTNGGEDWYMIEESGPPFMSLTRFYHHPQNPDLIYGIGGRRIYKSTDFGVSWENKVNGIIDDGIGNTNAISDFAIFEKNPEIMYCTQRQAKDNKGHLYKTTNGGEEWFRIDSALINLSQKNWINSLWLDLNNAKRLYVGLKGREDGGLYLTEDDGQNWRRIYAGSIEAGRSGLMKSDNQTPHNIYFSTDFGIAKLLDTFTVTTIREIDNQIPVNYYLSQNFPNPFNPVTTIKFSIPALTPSLSLGERVSEGRVRVTLKIYDVLGREVATLVNEAKEPGIYEVKFDASKLSSGVYIYRLTSKDFTASRKMMVVK